MTSKIDSKALSNFITPPTLEQLPQPALPEVSSQRLCGRAVRLRYARCQDSIRRLLPRPRFTVWWPVRSSCRGPPHFFPRSVSGGTSPCRSCGHFEVCRSSQTPLTKQESTLPRRVAVCLAIPGKILEIQEQGKMRAARVQFGGIVRQVSLDFVPEAGLGDYVMVHVGFAISRVDASEAERTYRLLEEMGVL